ncbi:MAG TPA: presqualene diphosphate synthase HpnD [Caulobacteraceae bacterium]|jgi:phytoene synthase|nr:presqualene diphosphate synthase HpnD [Caulobacteraceae bacterium]
MTIAVDQSFDPGALEAKVSGSSFYTAMKLMPRIERLAMFAIYGFCRQVDDIADDGQGTRADRAMALDRWRADLDALYAGQPGGQAAFLAEAVRRYGLGKQDFLAIIDGMAMDVAEDIVGPDLATFDLYCDRVASAVGRLSVKVFGMDEAPGIKLAYHLGRALQITNILRDLDEDAAIGRLYLPRELLEGAGVAVTTPAEVIAHPHIDKACQKLAVMAREHYAAADAVLASKPKGRLMTPRLMGAVYGAILDKTAAAGWTAPRTRASVGKAALLWIVLRCGLKG